MPSGECENFVTTRRTQVTVIMVLLALSLLETMPQLLVADQVGPMAINASGQAYTIEIGNQTGSPINATLMLEGLASMGTHTVAMSNLSGWLLIANANYSIPDGQGLLNPDLTVEIHANASGKALTLQGDLEGDDVVFANPQSTFGTAYSLSLSGPLSMNFEAVSSAPSNVASFNVSNSTVTTSTIETSPQTEVANTTSENTTTSATESNVTIPATTTVTSSTTTTNSTTTEQAYSLVTGTTNLVTVTVNGRADRVPYGSSADATLSLTGTLTPGADSRVQISKVTGLLQIGDLTYPLIFGDGEGVLQNNGFVKVHAGAVNGEQVFLDGTIMKIGASTIQGSFVFLAQPYDKTVYFAMFQGQISMTSVTTTTTVNNTITTTSVQTTNSTSSIVQSETNSTTSST